MHSFFFHTHKEDPGKGQIPSEQIQESIDLYPPATNISDGDEFLDDAIRMKDQPLEETTVEKNQ